MKGKIEDVRFRTDKKDKPYAVATIMEGEEVRDVYTWERGQMEALESTEVGRQIEYELKKKKDDFKFDKFEEMKIFGGPAKGEEDSGYEDLNPESMRIYTLTEYKIRYIALEVAGEQMKGENLPIDEKKEKTKKLAEEYIDFVKKGRKDLLPPLDED
jgi:hypothetical protein